MKIFPQVKPEDNQLVAKEMAMHQTQHPWRSNANQTESSESGGLTMADADLQREYANTPSLIMMTLTAWETP